MPFYQKINTTFVEIPANGGTSINYALLKKEFSLANSSIREQRKVLFDKDFKRKKHYKIMPWWMITQIYPQSIKADYIFSVVRNPFDRMITIFFNFTKFKKEYISYRVHDSDSLKDIQDKFEGFIKEYHKWRNMAAGAGLNIIEILSRKSPKINQDMYMENSHAVNNYYYYDQAYFLNKDFQKNNTIFSEQIHKTCDVIKYENLNLIYKKYPRIFSEELEYEDFDALIENGMNLKRMSYQAYYNKYTKKFVQEHFEIDFYNFHYNLDL